MKTKSMNLITWILVSIILFGILLLWNSKAFGQEWTAEQKEVWEVVKAEYEFFKQGDVNGILISGSGKELESWIKQDKKWILINSFGASCDKLPPCK